MLHNSIGEKFGKQREGASKHSTFAKATIRATEKSKRSGDSPTRFESPVESRFRVRAVKSRFFTSLLLHATLLLRARYTRPLFFFGPPPPLPNLNFVHIDEVGDICDAFNSRQGKNTKVQCSCRRKARDTLCDDGIKVVRDDSADSRFKTSFRY